MGGWELLVLLLVYLVVGRAFAAGCGRLTASRSLAAKVIGWILAGFLSLGYAINVILNIGAALAQGFHFGFLGMIAVGVILCYFTLTMAWTGSTGSEKQPE